MHFHQVKLGQGAHEKKKKNTMASIKWNPLNVYKFLSSWGLVFKSSNEKDKESKPHWSLIEHQLLFWKFIIKEKERHVTWPSSIHWNSRQPNSPGLNWNVLYRKISANICKRNKNLENQVCNYWWNQSFQLTISYNFSLNKSFCPIIFLIHTSVTLIIQGRRKWWWTITVNDHQ